MVTNAICTVVRVVNNNYTVIGAYPCMWQETDAYNVKKYGAVNAGSAAVYLPDINADIVKGDYITRSDYAADMGAVGLLKVVSVARCNYGTADMHHIEIIAK